jgi:hypothetical protein
MPYNGRLRSVYGLIGHASIVWVETVPCLISLPDITLQKRNADLLLPYSAFFKTRDYTFSFSVTT